MKPAKVYFANARQSLQENMGVKLRRLWDRVGGDRVVPRGKLVAVKLHFGELGNAAYLHPTYVRAVVDLIRAAGGRPFLTDANTIYHGSRSDAVGHLETAIRHGFDYSVVNAPLIIADGLKGTEVTSVPVPRGRHASAVELGAAAVAADALVVLTHFKGHEVTGFGGTLKNLGMGLASKKGKLAMHSTVAPKIHTEKCVACGQCVGNCRTRAVTIREQRAVIEPKLCTGCGQCIIACPEGAIGLEWNGDPAKLQEQIAEYAAGAVAGKPAVYFNFVLRVSPDCDCYGFNDVPIVSDLGVLAATDPVAIDQAGYDLVTRAAGNPAGRCPAGAGEDKFRALFPEIDPTIQLAHAERLGLGTRQYELVEVVDEAD